MLSTIVLDTAAGIALLVSLVFFIIHIGLILWTFSDAKTNSSQPAFLWALVVFLAPLLGILLYFLLGRN